MSFQTAGTTTVRRGYGARWDINPGMTALNKLIKPVASSGGLSNHIFGRPQGRGLHMNRLEATHG